MNVIRMILNENELPLEKKIENISLNSISSQEKITLILQHLIKILNSLKTYYEKTLWNEEHWIYANLEEMLENDENYDQNEIKMLKSTSTLQVA